MRRLDAAGMVALARAIRYLSCREESLRASTTGRSRMRRMNARVTGAGAVLLALAVAFYYLMESMAGRSSDPATMMQTVGTVSGIAGGIAVVMIVFGIIGRKV
jgi:hypothetical protein